MEPTDAEGVEVAEDLEQILAAHADGLFDLAPATERWLVAAIDELTTRPQGVRPV